MAILKCKMCGGDIQATDNTYGTCDSCGSTMTLPKANDEKIINLFNRANHFRRLNEFDRALGTYESILNEDNTNAEAHWCVLLCRYGIEYVEDPATGQRIPTCHRVQSESILADADYLSALDNAEDEYTRSLYEEEAKKISEIQKGILAISCKEEPYDVFICYKETTSGGSRTKDSALAQDLYYQLEKEGYKVFFSRISLESKLGQQYEPYIFNALNSAKVMLVVGTKPEHFNAVWVKNEWSRFLALMKKDHTKLLIPCYRDMDAYDLPEEMAMLQSQDMGRIGFTQDILHGIRKVIDSAKENTAKTNAIHQTSPTKTAELKKYLEDIFEREQVLYTANLIRNDINDRINNAACSIQEPKISLPKPVKPIHPSYELKPMFGVGRIIGTFAGLCWTIGGAIGIASGSRSNGYQILPFLLVIGLVLLSLLIPTYLAGVSRVNNINKKRNDDYYNALEEYDRKLADYKKQYQKKMNEANTQKQAALEEQNALIDSLNVKLTEVETLIEDTKAVLDTLYSLDVIFGKYRDFVAVASIYEYIHSGRCNCLEGFEGAYNIFENDLRQNTVIRELNEVTGSLEQIRGTQYMLYEAVSGAKLLLSNMANDISRQPGVISEESRLTEYLNKEKEKNRQLLTEVKQSYDGLRVQ